MARHDPLESVAQAERLARRRLPRSVYMALLSGTERGITRDNNALAFDELGIVPRLADLGDTRDQRVSVLGTELPSPVILSPTGVQAVRPGGELAIARAARAAGTIFGLSNFASQPIEKVVECNPQTFFQLYWIGSRDDIAARVERARKAGARGLFVTLDWALTSRRDWGSPKIPAEVNWRTILQFAPEGVVRPGWVLDFLRHGGLPDLRVPNIYPLGRTQPSFAGIFELIARTPQPTWADIAWLRERWDGPFIVKGVLHPDDARRAVDVGATAISVSNHGGNNIDSTPAAIRALPAIRAAVGDRIEVLYDGGIRRGIDVVKTLALGADAVMVGRAYLYAFAARGEQGVTDILGVFRAGINEALLALGKPSVTELRADDVLVPKDFLIDGFPQTQNPARVARPVAGAVKE